MEGSPSISIRCPHCGNIGSFDTVGRVVTYNKSAEGKTNKNVVLSFQCATRICPNPQCSGLVLTVTGGTANLLKILPPEIIDFDVANIPEKIRSSLKELIVCHSVGAFRAAAIMVRRVLEEICENQGVEGANLHTRLQNLESVVIIPKALMNAMFELKLLGNDAAHVESKAFDEVGQNEVEVAIDLTKEIVKSLYQLDDIVRRLRALRNSPNH